MNAGNVEILKLIYLKNKKCLHAMAADGKRDFTVMSINAACTRPSLWIIQL